MIFSTSCGQGQDEKVTKAIAMANFHLTEHDCDKALLALNDVGHQTKNAEYLRIKASAYACKAGFSELEFIANDVGTLDPSNNFLGSLAGMSSSEMLSNTDDSYTYLQQAIDVLLYAGGVQNSSHANREPLFDATEITSMNMQAIFLIFAQMGKYFYYYGGTDSTGVKGARLGNNCIYDGYEAGKVAIDPGPPIVDLSHGCADTDAGGVGQTGHPQLSGDSTEVTTRMCEALVLMNNLIDLFVNTTVVVGSSFSSIGDIETEVANFQSYCTDAIAAAGEPNSIMCSVKDVDICVENLDKVGGGPADELVFYFGWVFEQILTDTAI